MMAEHNHTLLDPGPLTDCLACGPYERCFACRGAGVELGMEGDVASCSVCGGATVLRRRDAKGRFV
jgi:hypothetical protein